MAARNQRPPAGSWEHQQFATPERAQHGAAQHGELHSTRTREHQAGVAAANAQKVHKNRPQGVRFEVERSVCSLDIFCSGMIGCPGELRRNIRSVNNLVNMRSPVAAPRASLRCFPIPPWLTSRVPCVYRSGGAEERNTVYGNALFVELPSGDCHPPLRLFEHRFLSKTAAV